MNLIESFNVALRALAANKLRSGLTMLGMIIGVAAVIAMLSVGKGAEASITSQIESMGSNLVFVTPGATQQGGVRTSAGSANSLTLEDAEAIADPVNVPEVAAVAPELSSFSQVVAGSQNVNTRIIGVTPEYQEVRNFRAAVGDFIEQQHVDARSLVAVLGSNVATQLFGTEDPIGREIKINRIAFRVIGVLESKGSQAMGNQDDMVVIPITTLQQRLFRALPARGGGHIVSSINVQVASKELIDSAIQRIGDVLRERHKVVEDDFTVRSQEDMLEVVAQITGILSLLLGSIGGISLLVGGIGIMNIMLVSVTERTREIGIRKAVGAKRRDILLQFLIESMVISVVGGGGGIALGAGLSAIVSRLDMGGQSLPTVVSGDAVALAVGVAAAIGIFFGLYPAFRAARLNPIEALRYE
ncbi:MAG: ABC transporter permease [Chloroflexota bacterium]